MITMASYTHLAIGRRPATDVHGYSRIVLKLPDHQLSSPDLMERVCNRPNSLPALRQRIQPEVDRAFRPSISRQGNVRNKLSKVAIQFGKVHLRDLPRSSSSPDIKPNSASLEVIATPTPRYLSAPGARFSYDGLDLTGVIRNRLLDNETEPCHERREPSSTMALKKHFRKIEERKSARRPLQSRCLSASLVQYSSDTSLYDRKSWREARVKPWREDVPKYNKPGISIPAHKKKVVAAAQSKLLEDAWLEERDNEMWAINRMEEFKPVTVVLVSSQLQQNTNAEVLLALRETDNILPVVYDYMTDTPGEVIRATKETLEEYGSGIQAERLVLLCHGGPGHMYLLHKQIMTGAKIRRNQDMKWFWEEMGKLMSKRDYTRTTVILGGCNFASTLSGLEMMSDVKEAIKPSKVSVTALPMKRSMSPFEKDIVQSIFTSFGAYLHLFKLIDDTAEGD